MVRGCQRRIIHLKNPESAVFEEAFFILKDQENRSPPAQDEMVREANRILKENMTGEDGTEERPAPHFRLLQNGLWFLAGILISGGLTSLFFCL